MWTVATASAATIPFGALAHLLPPLAPGALPDPLQRLRQISAALLHVAGGRRLVLGVDDAQLLDTASATLVHQLALSGHASLIVTLRSREPAPDAVVALWKDGLAERVELQPLSRQEVEQLLVAVLEGPLDSPTVERLWSLTQGNALFLYEVVEGAMELGQLAPRNGVWRLQGELKPTARLRELIRIRLDRLGSGGRRLVEALAFGEPLGEGLAGGLVSAGALAEADGARVVTAEQEGRRRQVRLSHPLYTEVIRSDIPALRARDVRRDLVRVLGSCGLRRRGDVLRLATLQLDCGARGDPELMTTAAADANSAFDSILAERLGRAAVEGGAGYGARLVLGLALIWQGRFVEADDVLTQAADLAASDQEHAALALAWAPALFWGQSRAEEAEAVLARAEAHITDAGVARGIIAVRAAFTLFAGHACAAIEVAAPVLSLPSAPDAVVWAALSTSYALARCGRTAEAAKVKARGQAVLVSPGTDHLLSSLTHHRFSLLHSELTGLWAAGRHAEAEARATAAHDQIVARGYPQASAVPCLLRGQAALVTGHPASAARWFREAAPDLDDNDPVGWLHWCLLSLAEALAITRDPKGAERALADAHKVLRPIFVLWIPDSLLAEAWVAAAGGEVTRAASLARQAATVAAKGGQWAVEASALHTAVRMGHPEEVVVRLRELAGECDGDLVEACSLHAGALAAGDGTRLDQVSSSFEAMGALLLAAEASAQACAAHWRAGRRASSWASAGCARQLAERCEGAETPALAQGSRPLPLSRREQEVAGLAARGLANRAIAERLVVSVRTVEGHLDRVYAKLGVSGRGELAAALGSRSDPGPLSPEGRSPENG